jgi:hypothetical protein
MLLLLKWEDEAEDLLLFKIFIFALESLRLFEFRRLRKMCSWSKDTEWDNWVFMVGDTINERVLGFFCSTEFSLSVLFSSSDIKYVNNFTPEKAPI